MENSAKNTPKTKVYSANEICNIIKTCNKNGVTNIKISGIEVNFKDQGADLSKAEMQWSPSKRIPGKADSTPLKPLELNDSDMEELRELERSQRAIDDPVGFELDIIKQFTDGEANAEANGYSEAQ